MYAIVEIGGKQFRASKDKKLRVPLLDSEPGKKVGFDRVLLVDDENGNTTVGNPIVDNMVVNATVIGHDRYKKVTLLKKKRRKGYKKKQGHRQGYTIIEINTIGSGSVKKETPAAKAKAEVVETSGAEPKAEKAAAKKPATVKKAATTAKPKQPAAKIKKETAAKETKPAAKKAAPKKAATAAKKEGKSSTAGKKPAAKAAKKED
jgi:large subunit ribosomal protein L21